MANLKKTSQTSTNTTPVSDWSNEIADVAKAESRLSERVKEKDDKIREYRKEVSRKAAIANKRLKRLEESDMTSSPAYQKWFEQGGEKFSIRGKTYNEVQSELARINSYLDNVTSSVTGAKKVVKEMILNTGANIDVKDFKAVQEQAKNFFEIASKVEQYLRTVEDRASSIGYQKIWNAINEYTKNAEMDLNITTNEIESVTADVIKSMKVWDGSTIKEKTDDVSIWTKLPKI